MCFRIARIDIEDIKDFMALVQPLNAEAHTKMENNVMNTYGTPTMLNASQPIIQEAIPMIDIGAAGVVPPVEVLGEARNLCKVCIEKELDTLILPCKHLCVCSECANLLYKQPGGKKCPICRAKISETVKIYKP